MKKTLFIFALALIGTSLVHAEERHFEFESQNSSCFKHLEITEIYKAGKLTQLKVIRDNPNDRYIPDEFFCANLKGIPNEYGNGVFLTCTLDDRAPDSEYHITIVDEEASRDPSDYGSKSTYTVEKTSGGIRAFWGLTTWYYNQPIFCEYRQNAK